MESFSLKSGQSVGSWDSKFGKAEISIKKPLGHFDTPLDALKAITQSGQAGVLKQEKGKIEAYTIDDGSHLDNLDVGQLPTIGKGLNVLDFVNQSGESIRKGIDILLPTGRDNGKKVHVFMSYTHLKDKIVMRTPKELSTSDDLNRLRQLGYTVLIDRKATQQAFADAVYDPRTAGVIWFGHGSQGQMASAEGPRMQAELIDRKKISPNLKLAVFESCQVGQAREAWQKALPGAKIQAWDNNVKNYQSTWFNMHNSQGGLADLIENHLGGEFAEKVYQLKSR